MANVHGSITRITKEIAHVKNAADLSLAVACRDSDVRLCRALIVGPPETPYEFGFFEFDIKFPKAYPIEPPHVKCITTNGGRCRFNPNIYAQGKVCLSILGTWRGEPGEGWSSAQGLESVLISIQSLMSSNPYENEPGFEGYKITDRSAKAYAQKVRHETLRIAVVQRLEDMLSITAELPTDEDKPRPGKRAKVNVAAFSDDEEEEFENADGTPLTSEDGDPQVYDAEATYNALDPTPWEPFADLIKRRFLWYFDSYVKTIAEASKEQKDGTNFRHTQFECPSNGMDGTFHYENLSRRLTRICNVIRDETKAWEMAGVKQVKEASGLATQLAFQCRQLQYRWNEGSYDCSRCEIRLPDENNPFVWALTMFGKPVTNLDGGIFKISLTIPPDFPESWPRAYVDTPIFHHRVSSTGVLCYFPAKPDEISSHIEAIVAALEDESSSYDPRALLNPEAAALYWGGDDKRKQYNRKLRRSAQDSSEY